MSNLALIFGFRRPFSHLLCLCNLSVYRRSVCLCDLSVYRLSLLSLFCLSSVCAAVLKTSPGREQSKSAPRAGVECGHHLLLSGGS